MTILAFALALGAAAVPPSGAQTPPPARPSAQGDAFGAAGQAWAECAKSGVDARLRSRLAPDAVVTAAFDGCARQEAAIRAAIAAEMGDAEAAANVERIRSGGRQMFLIYITRERGQPAPAATPSPQPL